MPLSEIREIQDPVNREGYRRVNELSRKRFFQMHAEDHQVVILITQVPVHAVKEVTEVLIVKVVDDDRDHPAAAGAQRRRHSVGNIVHAARRLLDQTACRL